VVDGFECEHLAFRNDDTDWQIWIQVGDAPIPRKYVITSKTEEGAPQYTLVIRDWKRTLSPARTRSPSRRRTARRSSMRGSFGPG